MIFIIFLKIHFYFVIKQEDRTFVIFRRENKSIANITVARWIEKNVPE